MSNLRSLFSKYRSTVAACLLIGGLYLGIFALGITCPIKFVTGISCAGCGMTRACLHALRLDFSAAFSYHPLWVALPVVAFLLLLCKRKGYRKAFHGVLILFAAAMLGVYLVRLIGTDSDVVVWDPPSGAFYRWFHAILGA